MLVRKTDRKTKAHGELCRVHEYQFGQKDLGFAVAEITGRYPEADYAVNQVCHMVYYIISGAAQLTIGNQAYEIKEGDAILIPAGNRYFLKGRVTLAISTSPAWYPEQYRQIK